MHHRDSSRYAYPHTHRPYHFWALTSGSTVGPSLVSFLPHGQAHCQEAERSCSHLGTMVEFAVALGSKLDVINKHSFNNFRLRVGEGPPLLGSLLPPPLRRLYPLQILCGLLPNPSRTLPCRWAGS